MPEPFLIGVQASNIPIIFIDVTSSARTIVMANTCFLEMTGLEYCDILRKSVCSVFEKITDGSSLDYMVQRLSEDDPGIWEMACHRDDGSAYFASALMHPLRDKSGLHHQHILSFYPTDHQAREAAANSQSAHLLYQHAPGFIAMSEGPDHRFTFANDAYKSFVGRGDLTGRTVAEAMPEIAEQGFVTLLDGVFETGVPYRGEAVPFDLPVAQNGEMVRRYANFVYQPIRDQSRNVVGIFCEGYDVTEQKKAEVALKLLNTEIAHMSRVNAMGTMATTMAHELNQPLSAIANYASGCMRLLESEELDVKVLKDAVNSIQASASRAGAIIKTLRDMTDRRVRSTTVFDFKAAVEEAVSLVRSACSVDTHITYNVPSGLEVEGDRTQIQQVIINLLRNGCYAVENLPTQNITIIVKRNKEDIIVSVRDTGPGLTPQDNDTLFAWSDSRKEGGMGLGLSICRTIIEAHGGQIWLEHSSDAGTEFRFCLPYKCNQSPPIEAPQAVQSAR